MIIAGTGHRPNKLGGYNAHVEMRLLKLASDYLKDAQPELIITGMAQGWDMTLAKAAINLGIPFDAYVPFLGQETVWPTATRLYYHELLKRARNVVVCSPGGFSNAAMAVRNRRMVTDCDKLLALWDGSPGGTANAIAYAMFCGTPYINLWRMYEPPVC